MVVGGTISGKTSILHTLAESLPQENVYKQMMEYQKKMEFEA